MPDSPTRARGGPQGVAVPHLPAGLTDEEVLRRRSQFGENALPPPRHRPWWRHLLDQLVHFFAVLLWAASALALVAGLPELAIAIAVVVLVNGVFAFAEERGAARAAARLRDLLPRQVTVVRGGHRHLVDAVELVPGDVVLLEAGDRVPADVTVSEARRLLVDTSILTGESVPEAPAPTDEVPAGAFVVEGEAVTTVVATAGRTRLAGIARLTEHTTRPRTPLERELRRLVRTIAVIAVSVGAAFVVLGQVSGLDLRSTVVFGIGVTVALVPEALLPTLTLSLALGAQRMASRQALVRELTAVETLGAVTFICTDKTGTLTRNEMQVVSVWTPQGSLEVHGDGYEPVARVEGTPAARAAAAEVALAGRTCSTGRVVLSDGEWVAHGDPMEAAVDALARRLDVGGDRPPQERFPFDPRRRMMSVVADGSVLVKGAPDAVLLRCGPVPAAAADAVHGLGTRGLRTLAVARRRLTGAPPESEEEAERDLELLGVVGFLDPPRPEVRESVQACRASGITVAVVTGDHPSTAAAVASEVGLLDHGRVVLTGADLPASDAELGELLDREGVVLARVSPEDKLRVARALQARGHVVAMTGDGVNDGPALREADVGVAMGRSGSDVAREAADLVLLDDDFATIVAAVEQGRATFRNIRRFLTYHLTDNVAELFPLLVWSLSGGQVPLALGVLQILALDLATDTLSAVALGSEPARPGVMRQGPVSGRILDRVTAWRAFGLLGPLEALSGFAAFLVVLGLGGWRLGDPTPDADLLASASGAYFLVVVATQTANAFACRSTRLPPWRLGWCANRLLCIAATVEFAAALVMLWSPLAQTLGHSDPGPAGWAMAAAAAVLLLLVDAAWKAVRGRLAPPRTPAPRPGASGPRPTGVP